MSPLYQLFSLALPRKIVSTLGTIKVLLPSYPVNNYRLIHGHFHIALVIIPRPPYWPETQSMANMGRGMITRPTWKCPCIKLFITYFRHLEKIHPYWPETMSRPILARVKIWTVYFRSYWSYKNAFIWTKYVISVYILFNAKWTIFQLHHGMVARTRYIQWKYDDVLIMCILY